MGFVLTEKGCSKMDTDINALLHKKYGYEIEIYSPVAGTCKLVYIVKSRENKFAILVNKKKSIIHQYRFLRSNYLQKFLF